MSLALGLCRQPVAAGRCLVERLDPRDRAARPDPLAVGVEAKLIVGVEVGRVGRAGREMVEQERVGRVRDEPWGDRGVCRQPAPSVASNL
jgi:hypothetical protein